jgi:hypothetical protein
LTSNGGKTPVSLREGVKIFPLTPEYFVFSVPVHRIDYRCAEEEKQDELRSELCGIRDSS